MTLRCGKCGETGAEKFYPSARQRPNKGGYCKACHRAYYRAKVAEDREYFLRHQRRRIRDAKAALREEKRKQGCARCGETHPACLDFHHVDETVKQFNISLAVSRGKRTFEDVQAELEKCTVLCANCHRKLHYEQQSGVYAFPPIAQQREAILY